jgi:hypothetical protein
MSETTVLKGNATPSFLEQVLQQAGLSVDEAIWVRVRPGHVEIRGAKEQLVPANLAEEERARRLHIVRQLYGIWSEKDETAFQTLREELWSQWQPHSLE